MKPVIYRELKNLPGYWTIMAFFGFLILLGAGAFFYVEHYGHAVTGLNNQIVWGIPHIFAILLIVAASGALNVASIFSVFNQKAYKPLSRFSAVLAVSLLAGGLAILVLDLGRPDRLIVAMTKYNFKSIFAWNIYLYTGFFAVVIIYLFTMLEPKANKYIKVAGTSAFLWRLILTMGTGSIFAFIIARQAFDAAILAPTFIVFSFALGTSVFLLLLISIYCATTNELCFDIVNRLRNLLGVFVASVLFFVVIYNFTNLYATEHHGLEEFILFSGSTYTVIFWVGQVFMGYIIPLILIFAHPFDKSTNALITAAILVVIGGIAQLYVLIIGGQAYPLVLFPNSEVSSSFSDGIINSYTPSLPEFLLGLGGIGLALAIFFTVVRVLPILPDCIKEEHIVK